MTAWANLNNSRSDLCDNRIWGHRFLPFFSSHHVWAAGTVSDLPPRTWEICRCTSEVRTESPTSLGVAGSNPASGASGLILRFYGSRSSPKNRVQAVVPARARTDTGPQPSSTALHPARLPALPQSGMRPPFGTLRSKGHGAPASPAGQKWADCGKTLCRRIAQGYSPVNRSSGYAWAQQDAAPRRNGVLCADT